MKHKGKKRKFSRRLFPGELHCTWVRLGGQSRRKDLLGYPLLIWCALVTCPHLPGSSQTCASSLLFPWWPLTGPLLKGLSKWNVQLTAPILPLYVKKLEENPNEVKEKKKKNSPWHTFVFFIIHQWDVRTLYWKHSHKVGINCPNMAKP